MRSPSDALLLAIFVFLRLYTVVAHSSMSRFLRRGISRLLDCSGFSGSVWSMNCMNILSRSLCAVEIAITCHYSFTSAFCCSCSHKRINAETVISLSSASCFSALRSSLVIVIVRFTIFLSAMSMHLPTRISVYLCNSISQDG